jgi:hypothetical protein
MALGFAITTDAPADEDISERVLTIYVNDDEVEVRRFDAMKRDLGEVIVEAGDAVELHLVEVLADGDESSPIVYTFKASEDYVPGPTGEIGVRLARIGL